MKILKNLFVISLLTITINLSVSAQVVSDSVSMGAGYANDIFYSFANGEVQNSDRTVWDIAFTTNAMSASILVNVGAGVEAYEYINGDTTDWLSLDTTGLSSWPRLYNSDTTWEEGAFNQNATGHPDYGWCLYNTVTHNLHGYKIYILKWANGDMKKLWIKKKFSILRTFVFVYSDLDNSNEQEVTLDCSAYNTKNFLYYSLMDNQLVDYEPASTDWDILVTRYQDWSIPYFVTGILMNYNTMGALVYSTDHTITDTTNAGFTEDIAVIGSNWKEFNMSTFSYDIIDSMVYFVETSAGDVYRLVFTGFAGMSTGNVYFDKELLHTSFISKPNEIGFELEFYPNPSQTNIIIIHSLPVTEPDATFKIYDIAGREVFSREVSNNSRVFSINHSLQAGNYILELRTENYAERRKIIIE